MSSHEMSIVLFGGTYRFVAEQQLYSADVSAV